MTTNQALNQGGITRIVNVSGQRSCMLALPSNNRNSPAANNQTIVNALQKPRQTVVPIGTPAYPIRPNSASGVFMSPSTPSSSPTASPAWKRLKLNDGTAEAVGGSSGEGDGLRKRILEHRQLRLHSVKEK